VGSTHLPEEKINLERGPPWPLQPMQIP